MFSVSCFLFYCLYNILQIWFFFLFPPFPILFSHIFSFPLSCISLSLYLFLIIHPFIFYFFALYPMSSGLFVFKQDGESNWSWQRFSRHIASFLFQSLVSFPLEKANQPNNNQANKHQCGLCTTVATLSHLPDVLYLFLPLQCSEWTPV